MSDKAITADLLARLQRHYIKPGDLMPGGMFMPEVTLEGRRADALYVGFFASRGKFLVGHELKVSRADWLHELADPSKAEIWFRECHSWYLVVPHASIVHEGELPPGWGLMTPGKSVTRMNVLVKAEHRPDVQPSWAATHAIVQRADSLRMSEVSRDREKQRQDSETEIARRVEQTLAFKDPGREAEARAARLETLLREVGEVLGVDVQGPHVDWDTSSVNVESLRTSFAAWLAADEAIRADVYQHRIGALSALRDELGRAEASLRVLLSEVRP